LKKDWRVIRRLPVAVKLAVDGPFYTAVPTASPPGIKTRPSNNTVAVCPLRGIDMLPVAGNAPGVWTIARGLWPNKKVRRIKLVFISGLSKMTARRLLRCSSVPGHLCRRRDHTDRVVPCIRYK